MNPPPAPPSHAPLGRRPRAAKALYLEDKSLVRVRFNEVDALHIVWHGHYANYFEEGRRAFGRRYGIDYPVFFDHQVAAPVVQLQIEYLAPAQLNDVLEVTARLLKSEAAKLEFEYEIRRQGQETLLATGHTVQVFTTPTGELLLNWPPMMIERLKAWEPLWKHPPSIKPSP